MERGSDGEEEGAWQNCPQCVELEKRGEKGSPHTPAALTRRELIMSPSPMPYTGHPRDGELTLLHLVLALP